jgi:hypothetical protein
VRWGTVSKRVDLELYPSNLCAEGLLASEWTLNFTLQPVRWGTVSKRADLELYPSNLCAEGLLASERTRNTEWDSSPNPSKNKSRSLGWGLSAQHPLLMFVAIKIRKSNPVFAVSDIPWRRERQRERGEKENRAVTLKLLHRCLHTCEWRPFASCDT